MKCIIPFSLIVLSLINSACKNNSPKSGIFIEVGDSLEITPFMVELNLSKKAEEKLATYKESIIIVTEIFGKPISGLKKEEAIKLASSKIELTDMRKAIFDRIKISKSTYSALTDKNIWIVINAYSSRRFVNKNFLDIDVVKYPLEKEIGSYVLNGKLIGE